MDMEVAKFLFQILQFVLTGGIGVYVYLTAKNRVTNERIGALEHDLDARLDDHGQRLAGLEKIVEFAPTHADMGRLHEKINGVRGDVSGVAGRLDGIDASLRQLTNIIMQKGLR